MKDDQSLDDFLDEYEKYKSSNKHESEEHKKRIKTDSDSDNNKSKGQINKRPTILDKIKKNARQKKSSSPSTEAYREELYYFANENELTPHQKFRIFLIKATIPASWISIFLFIIFVVGVVIVYSAYVINLSLPEPAFTDQHFIYVQNFFAGIQEVLFGVFSGIVSILLTLAVKKPNLLAELLKKDDTEELDI